MKKCLLYALSFAVLSIGLFLSFSSSASAVAQPFPAPLPNCTETDIPTMPSEYNDWLAGYTENSETRVFIVRMKTDSTPQKYHYLFYTVPHDVSVTGNNFSMDTYNTGTPNYNRFNFATGNRASTWVMYFRTPITDINDIEYVLSPRYESALGTNQLLRGTITMSEEGTANATFGRGDCVIKAKNIRYTADWNDATDDYRYTEGDEPNIETPPEGCDVLDFGCWLSGLIDTIGGTIEGAISAVVKAFTWLLVPNGSAFANSFDELMDFFSDKLGFLFYPFSVLQDVFEQFGVDNGSSSTLGNYCFPSANFFGGNICLNTNVAIMSYLRPLLQGLLAVGVVYGFRNKYKEVVHK